MNFFFSAHYLKRILIGLAVGARFPERFLFDEKLAKRLFASTGGKKKKSRSTDLLLDESDDCEDTDDIEPYWTEESAQQNEDALEKVCNADLGDFSHHISHNLEDSAYARVTGNDGTTRVIKKSAAVWYLQNSFAKLSSDRKIRVTQSSACKDRQKEIVQSVGKRTVRIGDWCVFESGDKKGTILFGRVVALAEMDRKKTEGSKFVSEWVNGDKGSEKIGALCVWYGFDWDGNKLTGKLISSKTAVHGFQSFQNYICSCPPPHFVTPGDVQSLCLSSESVAELENLIHRSNKRKL